MAYLRDVNGFLLNNLPPAPGSTDILANYTMPEQNLFIGPQSNLPQTGFDNIYQASNALTWIRWSHAFKAGGEDHNINKTILSGGLGQAPFQRVIQLSVRVMF